MSGLQVTSVGPPGAPRILCLHGFLGNGEDWRPLAARLQDRYQVDLVDLPGHGRSRDLPSALYTWPGALDELGRLACGASALVGYSLGGRAALTLALTAGLKRVQALVVVSASPGLENAADRERRAREDEARAAALERDGLPVFLSEWYAQPLFASLAGQPDLRARLLAQRSSASAPELARALRGMSVAHQRPLWNELPGLREPALFVAGAEDAAYAGMMQRAADLSPVGRSLMVPRSGHMPHLEQPGVCLAALAEFIEQHVG